MLPLRCLLFLGILFCMVDIQVVCLFYPLYYGGQFIIMVLLTVDTIRNREETTDVIGSEDTDM